MSEQSQQIPLDGATRVTFDMTGAHLNVGWREGIEEIRVSGADLDVERAGDELFLRLERRSGGGGLFDMLPNISTPGVKINWGGAGNSIEVSDDEGVIVNTGLGRRESASGGETVAVELPATLATTSIELNSGDLALTAPAGRVDAELKTGRLRSSGGDAELTAALGSGNARIRDLAGSLIVMGGSGNVEITDCRASTQVKAGSGEIALSRITGDAIDVAAGSGDVTMRACQAAELTCQTGSGDIQITGGEADRITARSGSGNVTCSAVFGPDTQIITTGSGAVSLGVPRGLAARFEISTQSGEIDSEVQLVSVGQRGPRSRRTRRQVGSVGYGDPRAEVSVRTSSGDISLHWLRAGSTAATSDTSIPMPSPSTAASEPVDAAVEDRETRPEPADSPDEREVILQSLARGDISVDEAEELLRLAELERQ